MPRMQVRGASSQRRCSLGALAIRLTCCLTTDRLFPPAAAYALVLMIEDHLRTSSVRRSTYTLKPAMGWVQLHLLVSRPHQPPDLL